MILYLLRVIIVYGGLCLRRPLVSPTKKNEIRTHTRSSIQFKYWLFKTLCKYLCFNHKKVLKMKRRYKQATKNSLEDCV